MKTQTLYRFFDSEGNLLYVGISKFFEARMKQHYRHSPWFFESASVTLEHYETRQQVELAESIAIKTENPIHNKAGKPGYESSLDHFAKLKDYVYYSTEPDSTHAVLIETMKLRLEANQINYKRKQSRWIAFVFIEAYEMLFDDSGSGCEHCDLMHSHGTINEWSTNAYKELREVVNAAN
jgi:predicted GIY-YIG superfamily endonuclease